MTLQAGKLRALVEIQNKTEGGGGWGDPPPGWSTYARVWTDLLHLSGSETIKAGAVTSTVNASARIRYREDITPAMRLLHDGKTYNIEAVLPGGSREHVDLVLKLTQ